MSDRPAYRASGFIRVAGLLVLLAGVVVMHILVVAPAHVHSAGYAAAQPITGAAAQHDKAGTVGARHDPMAHTIVGGEHAVAPAAPSAAAMPGMAMRTGYGCDDGCCTMRGGMHACVFILSALVLTLGLALLGWVAAGQGGPGRSAPHRATRRTRPPPWTMPSLAELSILRI